MLQKIASIDMELSGLPARAPSGSPTPRPDARSARRTAREAKQVAEVSDRFVLISVNIFFHQKGAEKDGREKPMMAIKIDINDIVKKEDEEFVETEDLRAENSRLRRSLEVAKHEAGIFKAANITLRNKVKSKQEEVEGLEERVARLEEGQKAGNGPKMMAAGWQAKRKRSNVEKPYPCTNIDCGKRFTMLHSMLHHLRVAHLQERPFLCPAVECGKRFRHRQQVVDHGRVAHGNTQLSCKVAGCNEAFFYRMALSRHSRKMHRGIKA
jgi:hypothetical protein